MTKDDLLKILEDPRKKVIAIDFDGVICRETCWDEESMAAATPNKRIISKVNELHKTGFIVVYTARRDECYQVSKEWLDKNGVKYHCLVTGKMPFDLLIEDNALHVEDWV